MKGKIVMILIGLILFGLGIYAFTTHPHGARSAGAVIAMFCALGVAFVVIGFDMPR